MSNNHLADLETFVAVAEAGSFTQAAVRQGRSKAGVSRQIKSLEERLGARLLHRTTRSLSLTDSGTALYQRAAAALAELRDAESAAALHQISPQGRLRVSLPVAFGRRVAAAPLFHLADQHSGLEVDMVFTDRFVDLVGEAFDLVVRIGDLADSSLIARRLGSTRRIICAAPSYIERHGQPSQPADLLNHSCLIYAQQSTRFAWQFTGGETVNVRGRIRADSGDALKQAALEGLGIALLPDFYIEEDLATGRLVPLLEAYEHEPLGIWVLYPHRRHLSLKVRLAVDCLIEEMQSRE